MPEKIISTGPALGNVQTPDFYLRIKQNIDGLKQALNQLVEIAGPQALTKEQLDQIQKALQAGGPNPLNVTGLLGQLLQPQKALIPEVTKLPSIGNSSEGQVVLYRHVIWRFSEKAKAWSVVSTIIILDYEYNLSLYDPALYAPGVIFLSVNTSVSFIEQDLPTPTWVLLYSEPLALLHVDRISTGTLNTAAAANNNFTATFASGNTFRPSMNHQRIWIAGNLYNITAVAGNNSLSLGSNAGNLVAANYVFEYPSIDYPLGALFYETDRTVFYHCNDAAGVVNVSGNNVTWVAGPKFDVYWIGRQININNNNSNIASVFSNGTALVLTATGGSISNANYIVTRGAWLYSAGAFTDLLANIPSDLKEVDEDFLFSANDYRHSYQWGNNNNNLAWNFAPGDPGSSYIVAGSTAPRGGLWAICDGNSATVATETGNTASVTTPDLTGDVFIKGGTPGGVQNATAPTWVAGAKTDNTNLTTALESLHVHDIQSLSIGVLDDVILNFNNGNSNATASLTLSHATASLVSANTNNGSPHNHNVVPNPHFHNLSNNAAINPPSEAAGGLPKRIALAWYLRR